MAYWAKESSFEITKNKCANCILFAWKQPDPSASPLRRCTGCRKIWYCSKECQEEHWRKVHKNHCKFFSGGKGPEGTVVHKKDTCNHCIMQKTVGKAAFKPSNPNYVCILDSNNPKAKRLLDLQLEYPLPSTATYQCRGERIIDALLRLLHKIKMTNQPVSRLYPKAVDSVTEDLWILKMDIFAENIIYPRTLKSSKPRGIKTTLSDLRNIPPNGNWQMFQTFLKLVDILNWADIIQLDSIIKKPEKSLPKDQRQMSQMVRNGPFLRVADKILDALQQRVVSQKELAAIVCDGNMQRVCTGCNKAIFIEVICTENVKTTGMPAVMFRPGQDIDVFCCGADACEDQIAIRPEVSAWASVTSVTSSSLIWTRCDNCFLLAPVTEVRR